MAAHSAEMPAKKQSKWTPEEDALIIDLRGKSMKWEDISKRLPGRSAISCRLHYQNYLEKRSAWDEERKNQLARLYERLKSEMWAKISEEMGVPWRAAEAMHWQLGEKEMARRAGVIPFALANAGTDTNMRQFAFQRNPSHNYAATTPSSTGTVSSAHSYCQDPSYGRHLDLPRANLSRTNLPFPPSGIGQVGGSASHLMQHSAGTSGSYENQRILPGIAEITSGVGGYKRPPFSMSAPQSSLPSYTATSPLTSPTRSTWIDHSSNSDSKRKGSPNFGQRDSRQRHGL